MSCLQRRALQSRAHGMILWKPGMGAPQMDKEVRRSPFRLLADTRISATHLNDRERYSVSQCGEDTILRYHRPQTVNGCALSRSSRRSATAAPTHEEIAYFIRRGQRLARIEEYHASALLMAIYFQDMTLEETTLRPDAGGPPAIQESF